jgi:hypothetical protein
MGSVHEFKRRPKNERQFKGYRPELPNGVRDDKSARWQLRNLKKSLLAWSALVLFAVGIWLVSKVFGA